MGARKRQKCARKHGYGQQIFYGVLDRTDVGFSFWGCFFSWVCLQWKGMNSHPFFFWKGEITYSILRLFASLLIFGLLIGLSSFSAPTARAEGEPLPVYRFWSQQNGHHFYTISLAERNSIIERYPRTVWREEGVAFYAFGADNCTGKDPVHRFWSPQLKAHFYTIRETERVSIIEQYPPNTWTYEGIAYCAFKEAAGTNRPPIFRFWSDRYQGHFFTANETERMYILNNYAEHVWRFEGIGFYSMPLPLVR